MNVNFTYTDPNKVEPVRIEQVFAEKPGGGLVGNPAFDVPPTTAVALVDGVYVPIKCYRLADDVEATDTSIKIEKGSGIASGDIIGTGETAVACTAVDTTDDDYDEVTVTLGVALSKGDTLYQAKAESAAATQNAAAVVGEPKYTPAFVTGNFVYAGKGDQLVRLINGANLRKETANIASEVAALLPMINLV